MKGKNQESKVQRKRRLHRELVLKRAREDLGRMQVCTGGIGYGKTATMKLAGMMDGVGGGISATLLGSYHVMAIYDDSDFSYSETVMSVSEVGKRLLKEWK
jgi:hypothetical protein